jgi:hypothetical protein
VPFALFLFCRRHGALRCRDEITDAPSEYDVPWDPAHSHPLLQLRPVHLNLSETLSTLSNAFPFHVFRHHFPTVYRSHQRRCSATINAKRQSYMWLAISCMLRCLAISAPRQPGNQTSTVYHFFLRLCRRLGMLPVPSDNRTKRSSGPFSTCLCQRSHSAPSSACPRAWSCQLILESRGMRYRFPAYIISRYYTRNSSPSLPTQVVSERAFWKCRHGPSHRDQSQSNRSATSQWLLSCPNNPSQASAL